MNVNRKKTEAELHSAGATVRHVGPFSSLSVPMNDGELPQDIINTWVRPFYLTDLVAELDAFCNALLPLIPRLTSDIVRQLLGDMNWRPRLVAAQFLAILRMHEFDDHIGRLLVRSDVCDAGSGYCLALATFNTALSRDYLRQYLDYYLRKSDLWFDQGDVLAALVYLDRLNGTEEAKHFSSLWQSFIADKPNWSLKRSEELFGARMMSIAEIRRRIQSQ